MKAKIILSAIALLALVSLVSNSLAQTNYTTDKDGNKTTYKQGQGGDYNAYKYTTEHGSSRTETVHKNTNGDYNVYKYDQSGNKNQTDNYRKSSNGDYSVYKRDEHGNYSQKGVIIKESNGDYTAHEKNSSGRRTKVYEKRHDGRYDVWEYDHTGCRRNVGVVDSPVE